MLEFYKHYGLFFFNRQSQKGGGLLVFLARISLSDSSPFSIRYRINILYSFDKVNQLFHHTDDQVRHRINILYSFDKLINSFIALMTKSSEISKTSKGKNTFPCILLLQAIAGFSLIIVLVIVHMNTENSSFFKVVQQNSREPFKSSSNPENSMTYSSILPTDQIYKTRSAFVIPEYKLIFFTFPKVGCSEWKRMFMRMNGNPNWCKIKNFNVHGRLKNKIKTLSDYEPEVATMMMTSPDWVRAAIFREPKERVLSAFLDKAFNTDHYERNCCKNLPTDDLQQQCIINQENFESFVFFVTEYPKECFNIHWEPQVAKIDPKWWPFIDIIGYQHNLQNDAKHILSTLHSSRVEDGLSAWDKYGVTGWGKSGEECDDIRTHSFLEENSSIHNMGAGSQLLKWYTPETEKLVEKKWAIMVK